jgi:hypothetical protein
MAVNTRRSCVSLVAGIGLALALLWVLIDVPTPTAGMAQRLTAQDLGDVVTDTVYLPLVIGRPVSMTVDTQDRQSSLDFYDEVYRASEGVPIEWTGDRGACDEGGTSVAFRNAVQLRINYYRAMAGVPAVVVLSDDYNRKAQKAALMMSVNDQLSHSPPATWQCYSAEGAEAAGRSNLYLGVYAWHAIDGYVRDPGSGNYFVGHRRWVLHPQTQAMGSGDIPPASSYSGANALWVFDGNTFGPRPQTRDGYVAWPPPGYVPYPVVYPRWSFAHDDADFASASVSMTVDGQSIPVSVQPVVNGYGENTLVWEPGVTFGVPSTDMPCTVFVRDVLIGGTPRDFTYQVIVFDPG